MCSELYNYTLGIFFFAILFFILITLQRQTRIHCGRRLPLTASPPKNLRNMWKKSAKIKFAEDW